MASAEIRLFRPQMEDLEARWVPATVTVTTHPAYDGLVHWAPFTAPGTTIHFTTPVQQSLAQTSHASPTQQGFGSALPFTSLSQQSFSSFLPFTSGFQQPLTSTLANQTSGASSQGLTQALFLPTGTVLFNPLASGNGLNPGFSSFAPF